MSFIEEQRQERIEKTLRLLKEKFLQLQNETSTKIESQQKQINYVLQENEALRKENAALRQKNDLLSLQLDQIQAENVVFRRENELLREENAVLREENGLLREQNALIREENAVLREQNAWLLLKIEEMNRRLDKLEAIIAQKHEYLESRDRHIARMYDEKAKTNAILYEYQHQQEDDDSKLKMNLNKVKGEKQIIKQQLSLSKERDFNKNNVLRSGTRVLKDLSQKIIQQAKILETELPQEHEEQQALHTQRQH